MTVLGINLEKNGLRYCVLDGSKDTPILVHFEKIHTNNFPNAQLLMNWYETSFQNLIASRLLKNPKNAIIAQQF